jgi:hypothetical protein
VICCRFGAAATDVATAAAYPAVSSAPSTDCMIAPPRSRCRSAVPDAIPARRVGTELVSECDAGVPASPTPVPRNTKARPTDQYPLFSRHSSSMVRKLSRQNVYPASSVKPDPRACTRRADSGANPTRHTAAGSTASPEPSAE